MTVVYSSWVDSSWVDSLDDLFDDSFVDSCSGKFTVGLGQIHSASGGVVYISGAGSLGGIWLHAGFDSIVKVRSIPSSRAHSDSRMQ